MTSFFGLARAGVTRFVQATRSDSLRRHFKNAGKLQLHRIFSSVVAAIQIALVARFLSPHDYGIYALILNTVQMVQGVLDVRCSELILRYYFQFQQAAAPGKSAAVLFLGGLFEVGVSVVGALVLALGAHSFSNSLLGLEGADSLFLVAALLPLSNLGSGLAASVLAIERAYGRLALADSLSTIAGFVVMLAVLPFTASIGLLLGIALLTQMARGLLRWWFILREESEPRRQLAYAIFTPSCLRTLRGEARELVRFAFSNNLTALLKVIQGSVPNFVVGLLSGPVGVAYYFLGQRLGMRLSSFCAPILEVAFREMAESRTTGQDEVRRRSLRHGIFLISASVAPVVVGVILLGSWTVPLVFGENYRGSVLPVQIVVGTYVAALIASPYGSLLMAEGKVGWINAAYAIGLLLQISTLVWLVPQWSSTGAAVALAVFYLVTDVVILVGCHRLKKRRKS